MKKILVVDDQPIIRELLLLSLGDLEGCEFLVAENGEQAVQIALEKTPDLILMDIKMPGKIDGLEATRIIKSDPKTKNCCLIILTVCGQERDKERGLEAGADDYILKPFSPVAIIERVEKEFKLN